MIEKNPLESYEQELEEQKTILDSLNKNLKELMTEKGKINKYEYEARYADEEEKLNYYIHKTNSKIARLKKIFIAYHNIEELNERLNQLENIIPRDNQEKEEIDKDKNILKKSKDKNMDSLPEEIKILFLEKTSKEEQTKPIEMEKNTNAKRLEDYQAEIEENKKEIQHLKENIEKLNSLKHSIPMQEYEQELATLKRYKNRENGKLLRNRQIVNAYELLENNQERIAYLNSLVARDEQDARDIKKELDFLTNENEKNKRLIPKTLYQSLIEHQEKSLVEEESNDLNLEEMQEENLNEEFLDEELNEEQIKEIDNAFFPKGKERIIYPNETPNKSIDDVLNNLTASANNSNSSSMEENTSTQDSNNQTESSQLNPINDTADKLPPIQAIPSSNLGGSNVEEESNDSKERIMNQSEKLSDSINRILSGIIESANSSQPHSTNVEAEELPPVQTNSTEELNDSEDEEYIEPGETYTTEESKVDPTTMPIVEEIDLNDESLNKKDSSEKKELKSKRKPKKNIKKFLIRGISAVATALVILSTGQLLHKNKGNSHQNNQTLTYASQDNDESKDEIEILEVSGTEKSTEELETMPLEELETIYTETETLESEKKEEQKITENNEEELFYLTRPEKKNEEANLETKTNDESYYDITNSPQSEIDNLDFLIRDITPDELKSIEIKEENQIGDTIYLQPESRICSNEYDAYRDANSKTTYFDTSIPRTIIGKSVWNNETGMETIYAYDENANQRINELINNGGELAAILTSVNIPSAEYLTEENKREYAEGWYNANDIMQEKTEGRSKS